MRILAKMKLTILPGNTKLNQFYFSFLILLIGLTGYETFYETLWANN
jgi:hypothetical protein